MEFPPKNTRICRPFPGDKPRIAESQSFPFDFCHDRSGPNEKKRTPSEITFKKCSLYSKYCIVFYPYNNSFCFTILQNYMKNCCQFVVNSDLRCRKPLILLDFLVQRLHCGETPKLILTKFYKFL